MIGSYKYICVQAEETEVHLYPRRTFLHSTHLLTFCKLEIICDASWPPFTDTISSSQYGQYF